MAKRIKNKQAKQMISDVVLKGRKAFWHYEESEIFAAQSLEQLNDSFRMDADEAGDLLSADWRYFWKPQLSGKAWDAKKRKCITKGAPAFNSDGEALNHCEILPLICAVWGGKDVICQISTSYA
ncbi:hypothetical protein ACN1T8_003812 [Vibrio cholerae]|uniref:hypothetical protein n=1 Tax=Vibrio cholerae TaxID=666 RepID=UPI001C92DF12|nr:hypothetical protein [Vibrio cholerae]MBY4642205.1 hypothetical protein [Vibrio cholerae]MCR9658477.1 hypothetical protein [Vibrio cholerae]MCR9689159.1 hypothetical protein [Vibrio cholerae]MCR9746490.1 hypothetical protein [Vibrio cholerae]